VTKIRIYLQSCYEWCYHNTWQT